MIATETVEVRNLKHGEQLPAELIEDFAVDWKFDNAWTWVAVVEEEIVGYLLAGAVQGVVMLMVLKSKDKHTTVLPRLLRTFIRDSISRGYNGWMVHLNRDRAEQRKLMRIAKRGGAVLFPYRIICIGGRLSDLVKW
jgi:hypothetical protein